MFMQFRTYFGQDIFVVLIEYLLAFQFPHKKLADGIMTIYILQKKRRRESHSLPTISMKAIDTEVLLASTLRWFCGGAPYNLQQITKGEISLIFVQQWINAMTFISISIRQMWTTIYYWWICNHQWSQVQFIWICSPWTFVLFDKP